jgi:hypothetical protein
MCDDKSRRLPRSAETQSWIVLLAGLAISGVALYIAFCVCLDGAVSPIALLIFGLIFLLLGAFSIACSVWLMARVQRYNLEVKQRTEERSHEITLKLLDNEVKKANQCCLCVVRS